MVPDIDPLTGSRNMSQLRPRNPFPAHIRSMYECIQETRKQSEALGQTTSSLPPFFRCQRL
eukprot:5847277-Karenia_brevis.AAC.1